MEARTCLTKKLGALIKTTAEHQGGMLKKGFGKGGEGQAKLTYKKAPFRGRKKIESKG